MGEISTIGAELKSLLKRISFTVFAIGLFGLAFSVFNWGLQYKMSLYQSDSATTQAPAKLWTGKTTVAADTASTGSYQQSSVAFAICLVVLLVLLRNASLQPTYWEVFHRSIPWKLLGLTTLRPFFFRPPPALA